MIIGNNSNGNRFRENNGNFLNTSNNTFNNKFKQYKNNRQSDKNIFVQDITEQIHSNVNSKDEMYNKSLAMLHDRLSKGLISIDEFNKQVNLLAKKRNK